MREGLWQGFVMVCSCWQRSRVQVLFSVGHGWNILWIFIWGQHNEAFVRKPSSAAAFGWGWSYGVATTDALVLKRPSKRPSKRSETIKDCFKDWFDLKILKILRGKNTAVCFEECTEPMCHDCTEESAEVEDFPGRPPFQAWNDTLIASWRDIWEFHAMSCGELDGR